MRIISVGSPLIFGGFTSLKCNIAITAAIKDANVLRIWGVETFFGKDTARNIPKYQLRAAFSHMIGLVCVI